MCNSSIIVIVPTHNEEKTIISTIKSLLNQTLIPDKLLITCDNCTDNTIPHIRSAFDLSNRVEIYETINNTTKKAGAINQALKRIDKNNFKYVLVMDADTILDSYLLEAGVKMLESDDKLGAVCSRAGIIKPEDMTFYQKIIWTLQHIEYAQFDSHRVETTNKIKVCQGMCTLFKSEALFSIPSIRYSILKRDVNSDYIYLEDNLVEDYELTLCLKHRYRASTCLDMLAFTDVPLSLKELFIQRIRWLRGGVDTLRLHKFNRITLSEILNHYLFVFLTILRFLAFIATIGYIYCFKSYKSSVLVLYVILLCYADSFYRLRYVQGLSFFDYFIKLLIIPEILYNWFHATTLITSYVLSFLNIKQKW